MGIMNASSDSDDEKNDTFLAAKRSRTMCNSFEGNQSGANTSGGFVYFSNEPDEENVEEQQPPAAAVVGTSVTTPQRVNFNPTSYSSPYNHQHSNNMLNDSDSYEETDGNHIHHNNNNNNISTTEQSIENYYTSSMLENPWGVLEQGMNCTNGT